MDSTEQDLLVGSVLDGRYSIICRLGQGGASVVYKAEHQMMKRLVAIKLLNLSLSSSPESAQRFQNEAKTLGDLDHPNVVGIHDSGVTENKQPYLVMEYIEGNSLTNLIKAEGQVPVERALCIFLQIADALQHAHNKGIVHRDLRPANIILLRDADGDDLAKIVDFGVAKLMVNEVDNGQSLAKSVPGVGNPLYMSPEQLRDEAIDPRSDIYSFGCVMYETLCGSPPVPSDDIPKLAAKELKHRPLPFSRIKPNPRVPPRLETLVMKALEQNQDLRQQSMQEIIDELEAVDAETGQLEEAAFAKGPGHRKGIVLITTLALSAVALVALCFLNLTSTGGVILAQLQLNIEKTTSPQSDGELTEAMNRLIDAYIRDKKYNEAASACEAALLHLKKQHRDNTVAAADINDRLASIYELQKTSPEKAMSCAENSAKIIFAESRAAEQKKDYVRSVELMERLCKATEKSKGPNSSEYMTALYYLASSHQALGAARGDQQELEQSRDLFNQILAMRKKNIPLPAEVVAQTLTGLGATYSVMHQDDEAVKHYLAALEACKMKVNATVIASVILAIRSTADNYAGTIKFSQAAALYKGILSLTDYVNVNSGLAQQMLQALANCEYRMKNYTDARMHCRQALEAYRNNPTDKTEPYLAENAGYCRHMLHKMDELGE